MKNCPNCGAPIETAECPYCGTLFLDFGAIDIQDFGKPVFLRFKDRKHTYLRRVVLQNVSMQTDIEPVGFYADNTYIPVRPFCNETITMEFMTVASGDIRSVTVDHEHTSIHPEADSDIYEAIKEVIK